LFQSSCASGEQFLQADIIVYPLRFRSSSEKCYSSLCTRTKLWIHHLGLSKRASYQHKLHILLFLYFSLYNVLAWNWMEKNIWEAEKVVPLFYSLFFLIDPLG